jgi:hypothetical protein
MRQPIADNEQIDRWLMRQHLAPETLRVVSAVWWGVYTVRDALDDLRGKAALISAKNRVAPALADAVAVSAFDDEMQRHEQEHETSLRVMETAALACLSAGQSDAMARGQIKLHAQDRPIPPPLNLLQQAYDNAKRRHAWSKKPQRVV